MLILKDIVKDYVTGDTTVRAMDHISLSFRESEFVAILGPSGCGKTTMLNIIGGLDRYTEGDLVINGKSTRTFSDDDWDTYRNHSIGFVFQSYNLIPHQSVLANVELALTLSGVSKHERRERAIKALERVGLGEQIDKKPAQMSGGQRSTAKPACRSWSCCVRSPQTSSSSWSLITPISPMNMPTASFPVLTAGW